MDAQVKLIRAIGSEFVGRKLRATAMPIGIVAILVIIGVIWLTTINAWWFVLALVVIPSAIVLLMAYLTVAFLVRLLRPGLTKPQKAGVRDFADKLERVADNIGTPVFIIVFRVVRDIIRPRTPSYIQTVAADSTSLHTDLAQLQTLFKD